MPKLKSTTPKLVGYSLASFIAAATAFIFFWILSSFYEITLIIDSETRIRVGSFFEVIFLVFLLIMVFTAFPIALHFLLLFLCFCAKALKKKNLLKILKAKKEKIAYCGTLGFWFVFAISLLVYTTIFLIK